MTGQMASGEREIVSANAPGPSARNRHMRNETTSFLQEAGRSRCGRGRLYLSALSVLWASCGDKVGDTGLEVRDADRDESEGEAEVADDTAADTSTPCPRIEPTEVVVSEGERVRFTLYEASVATVEAPALRFSREGDALIGRAPWTSGRAEELVVEVAAPGCAPSRATVMVNPMRVRELTWAAGEGPEEREHPIFWIDPAAPDTLVVGSGYGFEPRQYTPLWDLWTRDLSDDDAPWVAVETTRLSRHKAGLSGRVADGPGPGPMSFYVQGGEGDPRAPFLLLRDAEGWTPIEAEPDPKNQLHAFVRISDDDYLMTLGLVPDGDGYVFERDVWHLGPTGWAKVPLSGQSRPSPRYGFPFAWDEAGSQLLVVSGARFPLAGDPVNPAPDTWALSVERDERGQPTMASWAELETEGATPALRNGCWAFDRDNRRLFVFGGTADAASALPGLHVLELDGASARWVHIEAGPERALPPPRSSCAGAWDAARKRLVVGFGNTDMLFRDLWFFEF